MTSERPRYCKLAELMADHILGNQDGDVITTVMNGNRQTNHVRNDQRPSRPGFDRPPVIRRGSRTNLLYQMVVNERSFFYRSRHK
jgi:hypothetical protein